MTSSDTDTQSKRRHLWNILVVLRAFLESAMSRKSSSEGMSTEPAANISTTPDARSATRDQGESRGSGEGDNHQRPGSPPNRRTNKVRPAETQTSPPAESSV